MKEQEIAAEDIPLDILYEDEDIIVVNKPKGMVVHPAAGHTSGTLVNALMYHCKDHLSGINGELRPGIVHRIDMNTTGVLVACKNDYAHRKIAEQLSVHSITRKYEAICYNAFREETGTVDAPIGRNPVDRKKMAIDKKNGRRAVTHYRVLENFKHFAHIECQLETEEHIRSAYIWQVSVIRSLAMIPTLRQNRRTGSPVKHCMHAYLGLFTPEQGST